MPLSVLEREVLSFAGLFLAVACGILGAWQARLLFAKAGALIAAVAVCVGLAYFGWRPLLGGSHPSSTYFGATMLFVGLLGFTIIGAIEENHRRTTTVAEPGRGFPVTPARPKNG